MEFNTMTAEELETRAGAILEESKQDGADLDALETEQRAIYNELENRKAAEAAKAEIRAQVAAGAGEVKETIKPEEEKKMTFEEIRNSHEYNVAYANYIKTGDETECRALLSINATGGTVPVATYAENRIRTAWEKTQLLDLVRKSYVPGDLIVGFEIAGDDAQVHIEGDEAITEEELELGAVKLTAQSVKKFIRVSDEVLDYQGEQFLDYLFDEIAYKIALKVESILLGEIAALTNTAGPSAPAVGVLTATPDVGVIAGAMALLSAEAVNPVIVMNPQTWGMFKAAAYGANYSVDPFEGLRVIKTNAIPAYDAGMTTGDTWAIVGDFANGAQANFPRGAEIQLKYDDLTYAEDDLVKILGRQFVGVGVVANMAFTKIVK